MTENTLVIFTSDNGPWLIKGPDGGTIKFEVDAFRKHCLLNGLDDIGITLSHASAIDSYEASRPSWLG